MYDLRHLLDLRPSRPVRLWHGMLLVTLVATGCVDAVRTEPFARFSTSASELRLGTDEAARLLGTWSRDRELRALGSNAPGATDAILGLKLEMGRATDPESGEEMDDPSTWRSDHELLHLKVERFRRALYSLNTALVEYGAAMGLLADPQLVDPAAFDELRHSLNANLRAAGHELGLTELVVREKPFPVDGFALFSTLTVEATRVVVEQQRQALITSLLREHQSAIEGASALGLQGVHILGQALWHEYDPLAQEATYAALGRTRDGRSDDAHATPATRLAGIQALISLNERFTLELQMLDTLERAYGALPITHAALAQELRESGDRSPSVRDLYDAGKRLHKVYEELCESEGSDMK